VLLVALECCSLTFKVGDITMKNLIATSLFADGAAAILIGGDSTSEASPPTAGMANKNGHHQAAPF
jgi:alkylresorcinol/alkylpyrone synthase